MDILWDLALVLWITASALPLMILCEVLCNWFNGLLVLVVALTFFSRGTSAMIEVARSRMAVLSICIIIKWINEVKNIVYLGCYLITYCEAEKNLLITQNI